jgi:hypothetical protein
VATAGWTILDEYRVDTCHWQRIRFGHVAQSFRATCHYTVGLCGWKVV